MWTMVTGRFGEPGEAAISRLELSVLRGGITSCSSTQRYPAAVPRTVPGGAEDPRYALRAEGGKGIREEAGAVPHRRRSPAPASCIGREIRVLLPSFSIVIPTYSRPDQLGTCLQALSGLAYPPDRLEVLVVDDGGEVPLDAVVTPFRSDLALTLIRQPNAGPAAARNTGAARARGEFLAFTDDDCLPDPDWLMDLAQILSRAPESMVGGTTLNAASSLYSATSQLILEVVYRHYNANPLRARFVASNNMALSARGFREIGGFDPGFRTAEDRDLCDRWLHRGSRIIFTPTAKVRHVRHLNARAFCRQHFEYGRGAERFNRLRSERNSGSMLIESRFHLDVRNWLWFPLTQVPLRRVPPVAALLALWQATNLAGFVWEAVRRNARRLRDGVLSFPS